MESEKSTPLNVLVTGANRGIGLAFAKACLDRGDRVFAACRTPMKPDATGIDGQSQNRLIPISLDVADEDSISSVAAQVSRHTDRLDVLIHNAGVFATGEQGLVGIDPPEMLRVFRINILGPLLLTRACLDLLTDGAKVAILTSRTSVLRPPPFSENPGGQFSYPASKAAVNRTIPVLAADLAPRGILVCGLDPGWVRTDMTSGVDTGARFQLEPEQSVAGMLAVLDRLDADASGQLFRWNGERSRWYAPKESDDELQIRTGTPT